MIHTCWYCNWQEGHVTDKNIYEYIHANTLSRPIKPNYHIRRRKSAQHILRRDLFYLGYSMRDRESLTAAPLPV